jgi:hypothetical protein
MFVPSNSMDRQARSHRNNLNENGIRDLLVEDRAHRKYSNALAGNARSAPTRQSTRISDKILMIYSHINAASVTDVMFTLDQPKAQSVYLCGDFNEWLPRSLRMFQRGANGEWERLVPLRPGRYQYVFIVDGEMVHDQTALENTPNDRGALNSIIVVPERPSRFNYSPDP